jgi:hypothetical protein
LSTQTFLVLVVHNIDLTTIEHAPKCQSASKLGYLLQRIINVYARAGFWIQTILIDNQFEKIRDHISTIDMNTPAVAEHIAEIERQIRVIKECARGILCTLPYKNLPPLMLIQLLHFVVMWVNNFPLATGISTQFSPQELIICHWLDYKKHCKAPFGAYCKAHKENNPTNSMLT